MDLSDLHNPIQFKYEESESDFKLEILCQNIRGMIETIIVEKLRLDYLENGDRCEKT